jgi:hypothetical protein
VSWRIGRRGVGIVVFVLAVAGLAVGVERGGHRWAGRALPTGDATWIWAALPLSFTEPVAFWAVRDFTLDEVPAAAALSLLADEEYVAWVNGRRVGSNRYAPNGGGGAGDGGNAAAVDRYRVEGLLLPGGNRLAVELRSARGSGGLLAALDLGAGRPPIVSDADWRIVRRHHPGILGGWQPLGDPAAGGAEEPYLWGRPPIGRWGRPREVRERPLAEAAAALCDPLPAAARRSAARARHLFDWGGEVHGYLTLRLDPALAGEGAVGLLLVGAAPRRPLEEAEIAVPIVPLPGLPTWTDSVPRRFRYAAVTGLPAVLAAEVVPVAAEAAALLPVAQSSAPTPLLGLDTPLHLTPAERAVRGQIDGVE